MDDQRMQQRVTAVIILFIAGVISIVIACVLRDWMIWATGALIIRFGIWLAED